MIDMLLRFRLMHIDLKSVIKQQKRTSLYKVITE